FVGKRFAARQDVDPETNDRASLSHANPKQDCLGQEAMAPEGWILRSRCVSRPLRSRGYGISILDCSEGDRRAAKTQLLRSTVLYGTHAKRAGLPSLVDHQLAVRPRGDGDVGACIPRIRALERPGRPRH
ncbi:unnamed protein product, partial [Ectocarpus sp. 12 AP-2014]